MHKRWMQRLRALVLAGLTGGCIAPAWAGASGLGSGKFEGGLSLAVAPMDQGRLSGFLAIPGTSCRIYLHGLPAGEMFKVAVLTPGDAPFVGYGEVHVSFDGAVPLVRLDVPVPDTCRSVPDLATRRFRRQEAREWTGVRLVQAARARFHDEAHESTRRKGFVVKWDAVAIDRETPAFARGVYLGGASEVGGWLRQEDLFPPDPTPEMAYVRQQMPPMEGQWPQGRLPVAVRAYLNARERCEHFSGEEGTDPARQKFLTRAIQRECGDANRRYAALVASHAPGSAESRFLKAHPPTP
jgi:hypothetical protein